VFAVVPTIGALAAILNAISDALPPFAVGVFEMPITPQLIMRLLRETGATRNER
jgi:CO/xanthine dehydrogenase Mo-binding subunit